MAPAASEQLIRRVIGGDPSAAEQIVAAAAGSTQVPVLVAAAVVTRTPDYLDRARLLPATARERRLLTLADACLRGATDRLDLLARDHLAGQPDDLLAAWIAGRPE